MITHPVYDKEYDCPRGTRIGGELRYHAKGEKDDCTWCKNYRDKFERD